MATYKCHSEAPAYRIKIHQLLYLVSGGISPINFDLHLNNTLGKLRGKFSLFGTYRLLLLLLIVGSLGIFLHIWLYRVDLTHQVVRGDVHLKIDRSDPWMPPDCGHWRYITLSFLFGITTPSAKPFLKHFIINVIRTILDLRYTAAQVNTPEEWMIY